MYGSQNKACLLCVIIEILVLGMIKYLSVVNQIINVTNHSLWAPLAVTVTEISCLFGQTGTVTAMEMGSRLGVCRKYL